MFFIPTILGKKGPLAKIWLAAHNGKKLSKSEIMEIKVSEALALFESETCLKASLRVQGDLLVGISYVTKRQTDYMLEAANKTIREISYLLPLAHMEKEKDAGMASVGKGRRSINLPEAKEKDRKEILDLESAIEPVLTLDDLQYTIDGLMKDNLNNWDYEGDEISIPVMTDEELNRRRKLVTMEDDQQLNNNPVNWDEVVVDDLGGPIDMDFQVGANSSRVVIPDDNYNITGQSVSEINAELNNFNELMPQPQENMQVDYGDMSLMPPPSIGRNANDESVTKRLRPSNFVVAADEPNSLVLQELNNQQIAANARPRRGRLVPIVIPEVNRRLIIDEVVRIPDDVFRDQIRPPSFQVLPDFPAIVDIRYPNWDTMMGMPSRPLPRPLHSLYKRIVSVGATADAVVENSVDHFAAPFGSAVATGHVPPDENDNFLPPLNENDDDAYFGQPVPPLPESPVVGGEPPIGGKPPNVSLAQNFSDDGGSDIDLRRRQTNKSSADDAELVTAISGRASTSLAAMKVGDRKPFDQFVKPAKDRRTAAMMFMNLLGKQDKGKVRLHQESSYNNFNTLYISRGKGKEEEEFEESTEMSMEI